MVAGRFASGPRQACQGERLAGHELAVGRLVLGPVVVRQPPLELPPQGRGRVGQVGADADHVHVHAAEQLDVGGDAGVGLAGDADHDPRACLVAQLLQAAEDAHAVADLARQVGVDAPVELLVRGLEAQEVAVAARLAPGDEVLIGPLPQTEGDRRDGRLRADAAQHAGHPLRGDAVVLAGLHDERAVAERHRLAGAVEDDLLRDTVALDAAVAGADAAVGAAAHAVVAHLDEAAEVDGVADVAASRLVRRRPQRLQARLVGLPQPPLDGLAGELVGDAERRGRGRRRRHGRGSVEGGGVSRGRRRRRRPAGRWSPAPPARARPAAPAPRGAPRAPPGTAAAPGRRCRG